MLKSKRIFPFFLSIFFVMVSFTSRNCWASLEEDCIYPAQKYFFHYFSVKLELAQKYALDYCRSQDWNPEELEKTEKWFFNNLSLPLHLARLRAYNFCKSGASLKCVESSEKWIFANLSIAYLESRRLAVVLCERGADETCIEKWRKWFFDHTPHSLEHATLQALNYCGGGELYGVGVIGPHP